MRLSTVLYQLSVSHGLRRLVPTVYGVSKQGVRIEPLSVDPTGHVIQVGEDACFVAQTSPHNGHQVLGVADGVGGWSSVGIDPSHFSRALMTCCSDLVAKGVGYLNSAKEILSSGYSDLLSLHSKTYGSSTACILSLDCNTGMLHTANLGDSGFLVIRRGAIVASSEETTHAFNCPFQLCNPPPGRHQNSISDSPSSASELSMEVRDGDVVVVGTDGLFDNLFDTDIVDMLKNLSATDMEVMTSSVMSLVERTRELSLDSSYLSPFAVGASKDSVWGQSAGYMGGKVDDITVIAAAVVSERFDEEVVYVDSVRE